MASNLITRSADLLKLRDVFDMDRTLQDYASQLPVRSLMIGSMESQKLTPKIIDVNGHTKLVSLVWDKAFSTADVTDGCADACTDGAAPKGQGSSSATLQDCTNATSHKVTFSLADYRALAGIDGETGELTTNIDISAQGNALGREIFKAIEVVEKKAETKIATQLVALLNPVTGGFSSREGLTLVDTNCKAVKTFTNVTSGATVLDDALYEARFSARAAEFNQLPVLLGNKSLEQYMERMSYGCCANGFEIGKYYESNQLPVMFSWDIASALGDAAMFMGMIPGTVQWVPYNRWVGDYAVNMQTHKKTVMLSPVTGAPIDVEIKIDTCGEGKVTVGVQVNEKLFGMPEQFVSGDHRYRTNGLFKFKIVN